MTASPTRDPGLALELRELRDKLRRLMPMNGNPERFHVEKDGLCKDLGRIANRLDPPSKLPTTVWRP